VTAPPLHHAPSQPAPPAEHVIHLRPGTGNPGSSSPPSPATPHPGHHGADADHRVRSWPLLILALPAAVAVWSGWVGIGQMTGFGQVHPLPGLWPSFHLDTAITLPVGVEAYAAYALRAWLTASPAISARTRTFARHSAIASLLLGMAGQVAYHLLTQAHTTRAPWAVTMAVSCLPVLVLGMGATLTHLLHADTHPGPPVPQTAVPGPDQETDRPGGLGWDHRVTAIRPGRLAQAQAAAATISAAGRRVSRRTLRAAGVRASNAELGSLAITLNQARQPLITECNDSP
jgi:hypothetical protein